MNLHLILKLRGRRVLWIIIHVFKRKRRWPLVTFFQSGNIAGINSQLLYVATHINDAQLFRSHFPKKKNFYIIDEATPLDIGSGHFSSQYKRPQEEQLEDDSPAKIRGRCFCCGR
ncbi:hypothetical protein NPIL_92611 [Nephila pilipes]|uniref:Uncharacterized protein n=1 Tax=Nephila pilipes TaxID=299642 RepID=A0A8X6P8P2_NEPPI|nr:hypothetical protein NPIL_92611 [Nephila pilipes]